MNAIRAAEQWLREEKSYNIAHGILPGENIVIDRLLSAEGDATSGMAPVYKELAHKIPSARARHHLILGGLISLAAYRNPDKLVRERIDRAERWNRDIARAARKLARLLRQRASGCPDVLLPDDYHPLDLIETAALSSDVRHKAYLYNARVREKLAALHYRFDLKYWPTTADVLDALADEQSKVAPVPHSEETVAAISARSHADASFIRAFVVRIEEEMDSELGRAEIPRQFRLSDEAITRCANAALGADPSFNARQVKNIRSRFKRSRLKR